MTEMNIDQTLLNTARRLSATPLADLFDDEPDRMDRFALHLPGMMTDFSKQKVDENTLDELLALEKKRNVCGFLKKMAKGDPVNTSEGRAAQHMALRAPEGAACFADGKPISADIKAIRVRMEKFCEDLRAGRIAGVSGRPIRTLVHIGIGGSDLGPRLAIEALVRSAEPGIEVRFAANVDAADINDALQGCDPEATMIIVASKSFATPETLANARVARAWLVQHLGKEAPARHMLAISSNTARVRAFGIDADNIFPMQTYVGGRYSLWSSVGLCIMARLGVAAFNALLEGAAAMDRHVLETDAAHNGPVLSALINYWNLNYLDLSARAIIPYATRLALLPNYLQQLIMESNGKAVAADGTPAKGVASAAVFGAEGSNAQHAFFQQLHQGPATIPVDFIGVVADQEHNPAQHKTLLCNMLAQSRALMIGRSEEETAAQMRAAKEDESRIETLAPQKTFPGSRPSTTILLDALSPFCLGALLAFYEHETVAIAALAGINPFDQWGVEMGKTVALAIETAIDDADTSALDPSTARLLDRIGTTG